MPREANSLNLIGLNELPVMDRWELERRSRGAVQPVYLGDRVAMCRVLTRYKFFVDTSDIGFGANLLLDGFWESWLTTFMARRIQPGDYAIDVGANHGYYTLLFADLVGSGGRVASIEPNPNICTLLKRNIDINGFGGRVSLINQAATAEDDEEVALSIPAHESKNAFLVDSAQQARLRGDVVIEVKGERLATTLSYWERLDFIKVDVEGAEEAVVEGLFPLLERFKPKMVLEFNLRRCNQPHELLKRLKDLYGVIREIAFDGDAHDVEHSALMDRGHGEDWLLYLEAGS
jgi:FkbM family methyltransferase